jgi:chemotaxis protein MotB
MKIGETAPVAVAAFNDPFAQPSEKMAQLYQDARAPAELDAAAFEEHEGEKSAQKIEPFVGMDAGASGKAKLSESELLARLEQGEQLEGLKQKLLENLRELMEKKGLNENIRLNIEEEGLRIQIMDDNKFSMFAVGSSDMTVETAAIMQAVAEVLEDVPNGLMITGHTDALPYKGTRNYSNWELSADRANAARRQLLLNGLAPERVLRVEGHGDRRPLIEEDALDPRNRRISILVLAK